MSQLAHYKKRAPFYNETINTIKESLNIETASIVRLNKNILEKTCEYIGLSPKIDIFSDLNIAIEKVAHPGEWALHISKLLSAEEYVNPIGGIELFNQEQFKCANIKLSFMGNNLPPYPQRRSSFENSLSIIDIMMFNSPKQIREMLDDVNYYQLLEE
jgi:hypothetical protein